MRIHVVDSVGNTDDMPIADLRAATPEEHEECAKMLFQREEAAKREEARRVRAEELATGIPVLEAALEVLRGEGRRGVKQVSDILREMKEEQELS
jgi:hypothetical protein